MYLFRTIVFCLMVSNTCLLSDNVREWESVDGKVLKAEFISANERYVTIRRQSDGRRFTIKLNQISEKDREWVEQKIEESKGPGKKEPSGMFKDRLNDEWEKMEFGSLKFRFWASDRLKST